MRALPTPNASCDSATRSLLLRYTAVRARSLALASPLSPEDAMVQSMADASPAKWHLAHTTWFFERFVLGRDANYTPLHPDWDVLFNSYYHSVGPMHARPRRGLLSRPSLADVLDYRANVDARISTHLQNGDIDDQSAQVLLLGTHHEQQHQELLLTDIKHAFWMNPLTPAYRRDLVNAAAPSRPLRWLSRAESVVDVGALAWPQSPAFAFDSESPRHRALVPAHALASRPVSNLEYAAFVADGGYQRAEHWLSAGWDLLQAERWRRPLYWHEDGEQEFTLGGWRERDPHAPACHLCLYEADAFARWAGARLPTEFEWEQAAAQVDVAGNLLERDALQPQGADDADTGLQQLFGDVWEWTSSAYAAYPGFRPWSGSLGEYNGKFMSGQYVLRGGSCATARDHLRASYRNFFPPQARWQFSGLRLAKDAA